jgi:anti-anti-sigma factor
LVVKYEVTEFGPTAKKIALVGRLDSASVGQVETPFTAELVGGHAHVALDLRRLDFLSSLGIRLLLSAGRVVTRRGGKVVLFGAQPMVGEVMTTMALDSVLPMVATEDEALARLAG